MEGLFDRKAVPITPAASGASGASRVERSALPPDGVQVVDVRGRLGECDLGGFRTMTLEGEGQPRRVLPSAYLEGMEEIYAKDPQTVFLVSGENTVYRGRAYLLVLNVAVDKVKASTTQPANGPAEGPPAHASGASPTPTVDAATRPDDIIAEMLKDRPGEPVQAPPSPRIAAAKPQPSVAPSRYEDPLPVGRGSMVVDRLAYIVPQGQRDWWEIRFLSDNTLREPPMRLLPSKMLERAQRLGVSKNRSAVLLRVSGQMTEYQGKSYLLLRKVLVERDMGQF